MANRQFKKSMSQHGISFFLRYGDCTFPIYWIKKEEKLLLLFFEGYQYSISNINKKSLSKNAIKMLNCKFVEKYEIWLEDNYRNFCLFEKMDKTPANFPRGKNLPKNKPL